MPLGYSARDRLPVVEGRCARAGRTLFKAIRSHPNRLDMSHLDCRYPRGPSEPMRLIDTPVGLAVLPCMAFSTCTLCNEVTEGMPFSCGPRVLISHRGAAGRGGRGR